MILTVTYIPTYSATIPTFYQTYILTFYLAFYLALSSIPLTFHLTFYPAFYLAIYLSFVWHSIWHFIWHSIWSGIPPNVCSDILAFYLHSVWQRPESKRARHLVCWRVRRGVRVRPAGFRSGEAQRAAKMSFFKSSDPQLGRQKLGKWW